MPDIELEKTGAKVSILVPLYNCAPYLEQCIESLLNQTHGNLEILISDDASTDNSAAVAAALETRDARIKLFRQPRNIGLLQNYNFLFAKATGEYITIQDSDDWSDIRRIEKQLRVLEARSDIVLVGTQTAFHYPDGTIVPPVPQTDKEINGILDAFTPVPASIFFRRELLRKSQEWHSYFEGGTSMDRYFIMELLEGEKAWHIAEPLYYARVHANSNHRTFSIRKVLTGLLFEKLLEQRRQTGSDWLKENDMDSILKWEAEVLANRIIMSRKYREYAIYQLDGNNTTDALKHLKKAFLLNPFSLKNARTGWYYLKRKFGVRKSS